MPRTTCERRLGPDAPIRQPQAAARSSNPVIKLAELLLETRPTSGDSRCRDSLSEIDVNVIGNGRPAEHGALYYCRVAELYWVAAVVARTCFTNTRSKLSAKFG
jgi:hypothetical protein